MTLSQWRGRKVALIFLSPRCPHCAKLLPGLTEMLSEAGEIDPAPVIISTGSEEENRQFYGEHRITCPILLQEDTEVASLYRAMATPMAYLVDEKGATLGHAAVGPGSVLDLFREEGRAEDVPSNGHFRAGSRPSLTFNQVNGNGLMAGAPAPEFRLPALDGGEIALASFRGRPVLLVFSDPSCKPCNELVPKLEQIHRKSKDLQVVMVGRGEPEANRNQVKRLGLTFPVGLQRSWEVSRLYGMFATPIGYLVDEGGVLVEDVAVGENRILALAAQGRNARARAG